MLQKKFITKIRDNNKFFFMITIYVNHGTPGSVDGLYRSEKLNSKAKDQVRSVKISLIDRKTATTAGYVQLNKRWTGEVLETHSWLSGQYHNKGLGTMLYSRAIQWGLENGFSVRNSGSSSTMAQRVWRGKSIRQNFRIVTRRHDCHRDYDVFYAYPLLKKTGSSKARNAARK